MYSISAMCNVVVPKQSWKLCNRNTTMFSCAKVVFRLPIMCRVVTPCNAEARYYNARAPFNAETSCNIAASSSNEAIVVCLER